MFNNFASHSETYSRNDESVVKPPDTEFSDNGGLNNSNIDVWTPSTSQSFSFTESFLDELPLLLGSSNSSSQSSIPVQQPSLPRIFNWQEKEEMRKRASATRKVSKPGRRSVKQNVETEDYDTKRRRNNVAVKKSREKKQQKLEEMREREAYLDTQIAKEERDKVKIDDYMQRLQAAIRSNDKTEAQLCIRHLDSLFSDEKK